MGRLYLVLGGSRSGKSAIAVRLAVATGKPVAFVATARVTDVEMAARVARHRQERPGDWETVEAPVDLPHALREMTGREQTVVIDCLSVWLSNELLHRLSVLNQSYTEGEQIPPEVADNVERHLLQKLERVLAWAGKRPGSAIVVSNEVGSGIVPPYPLGRLYRDILGRANQRVAAGAATVLLAVAGIPLDLRRFAASIECIGESIVEGRP